MIDLTAASVRTIPNLDGELREAIGDQVCKLGGDAVFPGVNGDGRYVVATVLKWVPEGSSAPACPAPPPPSSADHAAAWFRAVGLAI